MLQYKLVETKFGSIILEQKGLQCAPKPVSEVGYISLSFLRHPSQSEIISSPRLRYKKKRNSRVSRPGNGEQNPGNSGRPQENQTNPSFMDGDAVMENEGGKQLACSIGK